MEAFILDQPRRCPVCERLVSGTRCPLDDSLTGPDVPLGADDPRIGTEIVEGFRALRRLPSGGGGETYEVLHEALQRPAVLRLLDLSEEESFGVAERFAKAYSSLFACQHAGLPSVVRFGRTSDGSRLYVITAAVTGQCLEDVLLRRQAMPMAQAVEVILRLADALDAVHALGLVHGDVCPSRVWIEGEGDAVDRVVLTDAGLFEVMAARPHVPPPAEGGRLFCDPRSLSPEVAAGYSADARADLYALGILMGTLLTGESPTQGGTRDETLRKHVREPYPVATLAGVPEDLKRVVLRLVEKSPDRRFQTAAELKVALQNTLDLFAMVGLDAHDGLPALASNTATAWGQVVTIGGDGGEDGVQAAPLASPSVLTRESQSSVSRAAPKRRSTALPVLATSLVFAVVAGLVVARFLAPDVSRVPDAGERLASLHEQEAPHVEATTPTVGEPSVASAHSTIRPSTPAGAVAAAAPSVPTAPLTVRPETPSQAPPEAQARPHSGQPVVVELRSDPRGAIVMRDGFKLGETPMAISLQSHKAFMVSLEMRGYLTNVLEIVPDERVRYEVSLQVAQEPPAPASATTPAPGKARPPSVDPKAARAENRPPVDVKKPAIKPSPKADANEAGQGAVKKTTNPSGYDLF